MVNVVSFIIQLVAFLIVIACGIVLIVLKIRKHLAQEPKIIEKTFTKVVYKKVQNNPNKPIVLNVLDKGQQVGTLFVRFVKNEVK